jgi:hypothetical protein
MDASQRSQIGRLGAYSLHAKHDSRELTKNARDKFLERFENEVDPDRVLPEAERIRRAAFARKLYMGRLALKSAKARQKRQAS